MKLRWFAGHEPKNPKKGKTRISERKKKKKNPPKTEQVQQTASSVSAGNYGVKHGCTGGRKEAFGTDVLWPYLGGNTVANVSPYFPRRLQR